VSDLTIAENIFKDSFSHDINASALNHSTSFNTDFRVSFLAINRNGTGGAITITAAFDSADGSDFDVPVEVGSLIPNSTLILTPQYDIYFKKGDEININSDGVTSGSASTVFVTIHAVQE